MNTIQEKLGEAVSGYAAENLLGFSLTPLRTYPYSQGIDQLRKHASGMWGVFEAKGGSSRLGSASYGKQMSGSWINHWINYWIDDTIARNPPSDPELITLKTARTSGTPMAAVVTRFKNARKSYQITITAQLHYPNSPASLSTWPRGT